MNFSFTKAFEAITKAPGQIYDSVRDRILPTPGKRKRSGAEAGAIDGMLQKRRTEVWLEPRKY